MPLELIRTDIVRMHTDAIVNAANSALAPGGGVCGAIFSAAGYDRLEKACRAIGHCEVGQEDKIRKPTGFLF
jgi:O-acetyl-ADP-ribose deacetylase (regulator of RNase III)